MLVEHEMTEHIVQLPNPDGSLLLRERDHRINNELNSAICAVSAKAVSRTAWPSRPRCSMS
jgi:hypothetical protein